MLEEVRTILLPEDEHSVVAATSQGVLSLWSCNTDRDLSVSV
jgi:hypothetical protein